MKGVPKILLVDDDADLVALAKMVLAVKHYRVITAYSGEEALQKVAAEKPDLIILDIVMPLQNGFAVCEQLKGNPETASIPVLMFTGFRDQCGETTVAVGQGLHLEADDYIEKPLNASVLLERVEHHLRRVGF